MVGADPLRLRPRALVESVHDQRKHISPGEPTRHRSPVHFLVHLLSGLMAYGHQSQKPSLARARRLQKTESYP